MFAGQRTILDWLEDQGPGTWQDQSDRSGANTQEKGWYSLLDASDGSARAEVGNAIGALFLLRLIAPSFGWFLVSKRQRLLAASSDADKNTGEGGTADR